MLQSLGIAVGGAIGALLRFWISNTVYLLFGRQFPYGTLAVNIIGSFFMGFLFVLLVERMDASPEWRATLLIGVLGALTTFSTFSMETMNLLQQGRWLAAITNIITSVICCLAATGLGLSMGKQL